MPGLAPETNHETMSKDKEKEVVKEEVVKADAGRRERWEAWLENARSQRPDPTIFDEQRANGEFDKIPDWLQ